MLLFPFHLNLLPFAGPRPRVNCLKRRSKESREDEPRATYDERPFSSLLFHYDCHDTVRSLGQAAWQGLGMHGLEFGMGMGGEVGTSCGLDGQDQSIDKPRYAKELLIPRNRIGHCVMYPA